LLLGTAGIQAAGAPAPDFILPDNFLFLGSGSITFFGANSGSYTGLPSDGTNSLTWVGGGTATNSPKNYHRHTGPITPSVVPEPTTFALVSLCVGAMGASRVLSRRRAAKAAQTTATV